ncbi:unnamed protein product [Colias eurytheme]|nr:unnamed protein product [Colias eurytheme]
MKRYYGEGSRVKVWRTEETKKKPVNEEIVIDNSIITQNTQLRTYARVKPKIRLEATYNGVPFVTVYVDGGWLKRSYGHNFNSSSGMACIIAACSCGRPITC